MRWTIKTENIINTIKVFCYLYKANECSFILFRVNTMSFYITYINLLVLQIYLVSLELNTISYILHLLDHNLFYVIK